MKRFVLALIATALCTASFAQSNVKNLYASSDKLNIEQFKNVEQPAQLSRYFFAGYNTLCLPVSMTAEQWAAAAKNVKVERLAAIQQEGATLHLYFVECTNDGIQAGMPYLVYSPTAQYLRVKNTDVMAFNAELKTVRFKDDLGNQVSFGSSWETVKMAGRYGIPAQQSVTPLESVLIRTEADKAFLPTRCGFTWDMQSPTATDLLIHHAASFAEVNAIKGVDAQSQDAAAYNLNGYKMNNTSKRGIYVTDGKKVVIK